MEYSIPFDGRFRYKWSRLKAGEDTVEEALPEQEKTKYRGAVVFTPTASGTWELEVGKGVERIKIGHAEEPMREALKLVRQWGATRWTTMIQAFLSCPNMTFHESIDDPITEECTSMSSMFQRCSSLRTDKLNAFDMRRVTDMENMLDECGSIGALTNWKLESLSDSTLALDGGGMTKEHYSATLEAWAANAASQASGVTVKGSGLFYNAAGAAARQTLMESKGWKFEGDIRELDPANAFATRWKFTEVKDYEFIVNGVFEYQWVRVNASGEAIAGREIAGVKRDAYGTIPFRPSEVGEWRLLVGPEGVFGIQFSADEIKGSLLQVERWGTVKWTSWFRVFAECKNMTVAERAGKPDVSQLTNMKSAFEGCESFNHSVEGWDVSKVENMDDVFKGCVAFDQSLASWTPSSLKLHSSIGLYGCGMSEANYSATLEAWAGKVDQLQAGVRVSASGLSYSPASAVVRQTFIDRKGWIFEGDVVGVNRSKAFITRWECEKDMKLMVPFAGK